MNIFNSIRSKISGYYLTSNELDDGKKMVLTGPWKKKYVDVIKRKSITGILLSHSANWRDSNLDFLGDLTGMKEIEIYSWNVEDISPILSQPNIHYLGLQCNFRRPIDFASFRKLKYCFMNWRPKCDSIFSVRSLQEFNLVNYPYCDLHPLMELDQLSELSLTSRKLVNLKGIDALKHLRRLDLYQCTNLIELDNIDDARHIEKIEIASCKKISCITPIGKLYNLKYLSLNNCGKIQSLLPLKSCTDLEQLYFIGGTSIVDGDLSIYSSLKNIKRSIFANKSHYSHEIEAIGKGEYCITPKNS